MKKTKKLLALVLAMVMAFSLMAVTAAAYGAEEHEHTDACSEETVQPKGVAVACDYCGQRMTEVRHEDIGGVRYRFFVCYNIGCTNFGQEVRY